jgi:hypothetical protein
LALFYWAAGESGEGRERRREHAIPAPPAARVVVRPSSAPNRNVMFVPLLIVTRRRRSEMRKPAFTVGMLLALWLSFSVNSTRAQWAKNCQDLLDNNVYRCQVKSDFGTAFEDCFRFTSPGLQSQDFDLFIDLLGEILGCECKAEGSLENPQFNESREFHCVNALFSAFLNIAFEGEVAEHGETLKNGQAVNEFGDSFVFRCVQDPECSVYGLGERTGNPYVGEGR